ncbi:MAG TPA: hypothetical protein VKK79_18920, partial [Candidatus Lokiarchaeia archaeon]|nr:hypothetical protein [Candidatus Lokiarchaeia archaeon]
EMSAEEIRIKHRQEYRALAQAVTLAKNKPMFYYLEALAVQLQIMGYFHAAYLMSLSLLRLVPVSYNLHIVAAFCAYQLCLPFKDYLMIAARSDSERTSTFLREYWAYERFQSLDSLSDYALSSADMEALEDAAWDALARIYAGEERPFDPPKSPSVAPEITHFQSTVVFSTDIIEYCNDLRLFFQEWLNISYADATPENLLAFFQFWLPAANPNLSKGEFFRILSCVKHFLAFLLDKGTISQESHAAFATALRVKQDLYNGYLDEVDSGKPLPSLLAPFCHDPYLSKKWQCKSQSPPSSLPALSTIPCPPTREGWFISRAIIWARNVCTAEILNGFEEYAEEEWRVCPYPGVLLVEWHQRLAATLARENIQHPFDISPSSEHVRSLQKALHQNPAISHLWQSTGPRLVTSLDFENIDDALDYTVFRSTKAFVLYSVACTKCPQACYARGDEPCSYFETPPRDVPCAELDLAGAQYFLDTEDEWGQDLFTDPPTPDLCDESENGPRIELRDLNTGAPSTSPVNAWYVDIFPAWQASPEYARLPKYTWSTRDEIPPMAASLYYINHAALPPEWTLDCLEDTLLHAFPADVVAPKYYFKSVGRVVAEFCSFLGRELQSTHLGSMSSFVRGLQTEILNRAGNPKIWSAEKSRSVPPRWQGS